MEERDVWATLQEALSISGRIWPLSSSPCDLLRPLIGGVLHYTGEVRTEVRRRVAIAHQAVNKHRKLVYQCHKFPLHKRAGPIPWHFGIPNPSRSCTRPSIVVCLDELMMIMCMTMRSYAKLVLSSPTDLLCLCRLRYIGSLCAIGSTKIDYGES